MRNSFMFFFCMCLLLIMKRDYSCPFFAKKTFQVSDSYSCFSVHFFFWLYIDNFYTFLTFVKK